MYAVIDCHSKFRNIYAIEEQIIKYLKPNCHE